MKGMLGGYTSSQVLNRSKRLTLDWSWFVAAAAFALASFVQGLAGFGLGLVALSFLPYVMLPSVAIVVLTIYAVFFTLAVLIQLRRDVTSRALLYLLVGTLVGTPLGVWILASAPAAVINRLVGLVLVAVTLLEWKGFFPQERPGRRWGFGAGVLAGIAGGAVGTPGPPVIVYAATQPWSPRTIKANLQAFFFVNQLLILSGYWWAGLVTSEVTTLALAFAAPAAIGALLGVALFGRVNAVRFRQIVFALILASGVVLLIRG